MEEPAKPFACTFPECGQTFTNEDHLHVHTKKHDMVLQFGLEQKAAFVADQTPTPTRFIRNCEEVGLFQDLQNVNPFDEGFKRAMESKQGMESGITTPSSTDDLHTPQMFPLLDPTDSVFTTNQRNITISRSSSDESGAIKELETTTISKLTNQVTTISRIVEKHEETPKTDIIKKESIRKDSVLYNNVTNIKILSNVEIKPVEEKDKEYLQVPPIMSQQSIDKVVDSLTSDYVKEEKNKDDYEVTIKLPSGQKIKLTTEDTKPQNPKELLKKVLKKKSEVKNKAPVLPNVIPFGNGTLIPVSLVNTTTVIPKLPLKVFDKRPVKRKRTEVMNVIKSKIELDRECRKAASKRHREKDKLIKMELKLENQELKKTNERLKAENAELKAMIIQHMKKCPHPEDFRDFLSNNEK